MALLVLAAGVLFSAGSEHHRHAPHDSHALRADAEPEVTGANLAHPRAAGASHPRAAGPEASTSHPHAAGPEADISHRHAAGRKAGHLHTRAAGPAHGHRAAETPAHRHRTVEIAAHGHSTVETPAHGHRTIETPAHGHQHGNEWTPNLTPRVRLDVDIALAGAVTARPGPLGPSRRAAGPGAAARHASLSLLGVLRV